MMSGQRLPDLIQRTSSWNSSNPALRKIAREIGKVVVRMMRRGDKACATHRIFASQKTLPQGRTPVLDQR